MPPLQINGCGMCCTCWLLGHIFKTASDSDVLTIPKTYRNSCHVCSDIFTPNYLCDWNRQHLSIDKSTLFMMSSISTAIYVQISPILTWLLRFKRLTKMARTKKQQQVWNSFATLQPSEISSVSHRAHFSVLRYYFCAGFNMGHIDTPRPSYFKDSLNWPNTNV